MSYFKWSKFLLALVYLAVTIAAILIQLTLTISSTNATISALLLITVIVTAFLYMANLIACVTPPLKPQNPIVSAFAIISAILLILFETYLSLKLIINFIILIFPKS